jgi:HD-GYP domain-containing protein (c-di-GMP phosphodiesterase class II)
MQPNPRIRIPQGTLAGHEKRQYPRIANRNGGQPSSGLARGERFLEVAHEITAMQSSPSTKRHIIDILFAFLKEQVQAAGFALISPNVFGDCVVTYGRGAWLNHTGLCFEFDSGAISQVLQTKEALQGQIIPFEHDPILRAGDTVGVFSVCFPVNVDHQSLGAIWVERHRPFRAEEAQLIRQISEIAVVSIYRHQCVEKSQSAFERMGVINRLTRTLTETNTLAEVTAQLTQAIHTLLPDADDLLISHIESKTESIRYIYTGSTHPPAENELPLRPLSQFDQELQRKVLASAKTILISQLPEITDLAILRGSQSRLARSAVYIPMFSNARVAGILQVHSDDAQRLTAEDEALLGLLANIGATAIENVLLSQDVHSKQVTIEQTYETLLEGWLRILWLRDSETEEHTRRVCELTLKMAEAIGCSEEDAYHIRYGSLLHDIGKVGIPDSILRKAGPLSDDEWKIMRQHPVYAYRLLSPIPHLHPMLDIPYCHHEKWDGSGYPRGLKGDEIPLAARIFAVADVWDALTSYRPYRGAWTEEKTMAYIIEQSGKSFDPRVVKVFLRCHLGVEACAISEMSKQKSQPLSFLFPFPLSVQG